MYGPKRHFCTALLRKLGDIVRPFKIEIRFFFIYQLLYGPFLIPQIVYDICTALMKSGLRPFFIMYGPF